MPSTLAWLDHDAAERERTQKILALFRERESRDELGLGAVRDSFADQLFPGTSTIQTRLRYMLFVPWMYVRLEEGRVSSSQIAAKARRFELDMIEPLLEQDDRAGVFGSLARGSLKRLPSSVYWAGLGAWGIRRFEGSQDEYHAALDRIYRQRSRAAKPEDGDPESGEPTWDRRIVSPPHDFPSNPSLELTTEEAAYLRDRIVISAPQSLLALLVAEGLDATADFPWEHPEQARFTELHRSLLDHARRFSDVMHGAAILYNLLLSELKQNSDLIDGHRAGFAEWAADAGKPVEGWELTEFWRLVVSPNHTITPVTRTFVERWVALVRSGPAALAESTDARSLVRSREQRLKGAHSRFTSRRALDQWQGAAGLGRISYRWPTASRFLADLSAAADREAAHA